MRISALVAMLALAGFSVSGLRAEDKPVKSTTESVKDAVRDTVKDAVKDV